MIKIKNSSALKLNNKGQLIVWLLITTENSNFLTWTCYETYL